MSPPCFRNTYNKFNKGFGGIKKKGPQKFQLSNGHRRNDSNNERLYEDVLNEVIGLCDGNPYYLEAAEATATRFYLKLANVVRAETIKLGQTCLSQGEVTVPSAYNRPVKNRLGRLKLMLSDNRLLIPPVWSDLQCRIKLYEEFKTEYPLDHEVQPEAQVQPSIKTEVTNPKNKEEKIASPKRAHTQKRKRSEEKEIIISKIKNPKLVTTEESTVS